MNGNPIVYTVSERTYSTLIGLQRSLTLMGATATIIGLVGIVATQGVGSDSSELMREINRNSVPTAITGAVLTAYFGLNYLANHRLNKDYEKVSKE